MAIIKSFTSLEQSKKLAEILPLESADACWTNHLFDNLLSSWRIESTPPQEYKSLLDRFVVKGYLIEPAWSLAALLGVLPFHLIVNNQRYAFGMHKGLNKDGETYVIRYNVFNTDICLYSTDYYNNPVDACVAMVEKLKELNLL